MKLRNTMGTLFSVLACFLVLVSPAGSDDRTTANQEAPSFVGRTLSNELFDLSKLRGQWVLLDFWVSRNPQSREEIPFLSQAYDRFHSSGLAIVSVNLDENTETIKRFLADAKMPWIHIRNIGNKVSGLYNVRKIPARFLIDPVGRLVSEGGELNKENLIASLEKRIPVSASDRSSIPAAAPTPTALRKLRENPGFSRTPLAKPSSSSLRSTPTPVPDFTQAQTPTPAASKEFAIPYSYKILNTALWTLVTIASISSFMLRLSLVYMAYDEGMGWLFFVWFFPGGDLIFILTKLDRDEKKFLLAWSVINWILLGIGSLLQQIFM